MITSINIPITPSSTILELVSVEMAKEQLKVDHNYEDALITTYINAAYSRSQEYIAAEILSKDVVINLNQFFDSLVLPVGPVDSIVSITYTDSSNNQQTLQESEYSLQVINGVATLNFVGETIPETANQDNAVVITVKVGKDKANVPETVVIAILLIVSQLYEYRGNLPFSFSDSTAATFLRPYKRYV